MEGSQPQPPRPPLTAPLRLERWLRSRLPEHVADDILEDLAEEYLRFQRPRGRLRAWCWYCRQALATAARARALRADQRGSPLTRGLIVDVRLAWRRSRRRPVLTSAIVATLALGTAAVLAVGALLEATLLRPLPYPHADRLVRIWSTRPANRARGALAAHWDRYGVWAVEYQRLRAASVTLDDLAAYGPRSRVVPVGGRAERLRGAVVSASFFPMLGARMAFGRSFTATEERTEVAVVALGQSLARRLFGDPAEAVGRQVTFDGQPFDVVGVLDDAFAWADDPLFWMPLGTYRDLIGTTNDPGLELIGRIRPGVALSAVSTEAQSVVHGDRDRAEFGMRSVGLAADLYARHRQGLILFAVAGFMVCLLALLNVATLLIGDALERRNEIRLRRALGAGVSRLMRQWSVEGAVVSGIAVAAGLTVVPALLRIVRGSIAAGVPGAEAAHVSVRIVAAAILTWLAGAACYALAPTIVAARLRSGVDSGARVVAGASRLQRATVALQIGLALVLVHAAIVLAISIARLDRVELGFDADPVAVAMLNPPSSLDDHDRTALQRRVSETVASSPLVDRIAWASSLPFAGGGTNGVVPDAAASTAGAFEVDRQIVSADYFAVMGIPIRDGQSFGGTRSGAGGEAVISATLAARAFPGQSAIGRRLVVVRGPYARPRAGDGWTVVGVVADVVRGSPVNPQRPTLYLGSDEFPGLALVLVARSIATAEALIPVLRDELAGVAADVPIGRLTSVRALVDETNAAPRARVSAITLLATVSILIAAVGIHGVTARMVIERTREIGVRRALGSSASEVVLLLIKRSGPMLGVGLAVGSALAIGASVWLASLTFGVAPYDPDVLAATILAAGAVALAGGAVPIWRARRIDPIEQLRNAAE